MNKLYIFIVRIFLGAFFAVIISRFFFPDAPIVYVIILGVVMVGLAYVFELFRTRKTG